MSYRCNDYDYSFLMRLILILLLLCILGERRERTKSPTGRINETKS